MDSMWAMIGGWGVSIGTALYVVRYKNSLDKTLADDERRMLSVEHTVKEQTVKLHDLEIDAAKRERDLDNLKDKHETAQRDVESKFDKVDKKLDQLLAYVMEK